MMLKLSRLALALAGALALTTAHAQETLRVGVIFPLSGPVSQVGLDAVAAVKTAVDIVNNGADVDVPFSNGKGLPGLNGGKIEIVIADIQGKPELGQSETERLISKDKVHVVFGAFMSSVSAAASQVSERAGIPFVNGSSSSPTLTQRGFKYFFRTSPHDEQFSEFVFDFLAKFPSLQGKAIKTVSILHEDTALGSDSSKVQKRIAKDSGLPVLESISYKAQTTSLSSEIQRLKRAGADVLLPTGYTSDSILLFKTAKELDYNPPLTIAQAAGFVDPTFLTTLGTDAEGAITRSTFNNDLVKSLPLIGKVNTIFKKHSGGRDLTDVPAREFTAFLTLLDAVNRAGSTDPEKIRAALAQTKIPASQLIVPYRGVQFDASGQNVLGQPILVQAQQGQYCTVYPAEYAACKLVYPAPTWAEKALLRKNAAAR